MARISAARRDGSQNAFSDAGTAVVLSNPVTHRISLKAILSGREHSANRLNMALAAGSVLAVTPARGAFRVVSGALLQSVAKHVRL
ncbi:hypothetical protein GCM10010862_42540 [Devosia nitrariae]|uniref:Uncharacterized protein n=1 Tax=Devosia nitrariae TaxID=2071872 RepID=A0ABQ5WBU2_9HYPH|nr:hypothetical protein GCM10010862_42540 [Devosia nitrariae]